MVFMWIILFKQLEKLGGFRLSLNVNEIFFCYFYKFAK